MRFYVSVSPQSLTFLFFFIIIVSFTCTCTCTARDSSSSSSQSQLVPLHTAKPFPHSLPPPKPATALIADLDGTIYLVDSVSGRIIWSFSTGSSIYHSSYQEPLNNNNNNASRSGLIECGDDWELIIHDTHFGKTRLPESVAEYVAFTPVMSDDGAVILGSKRSTVFEVDAETGRLLWSYGADDFDNASSTAMWSGDWRNVLRTKNNELADPALLNSPEFLLKIVRTDYFLKSVDGSGIVLWTMAVAEFKALLLCQQKENSSVRASFGAQDRHASDSDSGLDFAMPYTCQDRKMKEIYRLRKNFLFEPADLERSSSAYQENGMLPMPTPSLMLPSQPNIDKFLPFHGSNMMLPAPVPNSLPFLQPKTGLGDNNDNVAVLPQPHMEITPPREVDVNKWLRALAFPLGIMILVAVTIKQVISKDRISGTDLKSPPSKKKRVRKSAKSNIIVDKQGKHLSSAEEEVLTNNETKSEAYLCFDKVDGRRVGKLFISNKEIAKGSNGTIVLEGTYEGRVVAVKRLVRAHHEVARKEIQNLIASDCHPNIVRWHGVEYDQDFVYLALELCACNLDDLISYYSDISENPVFSKDQASEFLKKAQLEIVRDEVQCMWKENGYPSPLLLKLMRDVVSGLVHLHELGIIHRDLKPQNVLITKDRSLCAKLSDMGISKRLLEDMSSLGHSSTGCGSSGWQAPEQLAQGRQTRAVDLFSLGCVLFFCMTAGRHPFGERLERDVNIVNNKKDLFLVEVIPEAEDLISSLLNPDPDLRPKAIEVLHHPLFWSSEMRLSFLRDASDRVELEDRDTNTSSDLLSALESTAPMAVGAKWDEKMEPTFIANIGRYRRYKFDSVRDLLRVMRNKLNHYRELPQEIQELVGPVPEGFNEYFASRYPRLLIEVYRVIHEYCIDEECFQRYFRGIG